MAVRLRLRRMGRKKRPFYRIVAADQRAPRDGRFIEVVGQYDPLQKPQKVELKEDRIFYWLANGAQPSTTVRSLLRNQGIWFRLDLKARGLTDEQIEGEMQRWQETKAAREKRREAAEIQARSKKEKEKKKEEQVEKATTESASGSPEEAKTEETKAETEEAKTEETKAETEEVTQAEEVTQTEEVKEEKVTVEEENIEPQEQEDTAEVEQKEETSEAQAEETDDKKE